MNPNEAKLDPELEKARDEMCIPVARSIMADMAVELFDENSTSIVRKMLEHALNTDMNIATEVSYVPQLILGAYSGLNATLQICDIPEPDDARFKEIAKKFLVIVNEANVKLGAVTPEETVLSFADAKLKLNALIAEEKLTRLEVKYIMDSIFSGFRAVNNLFSELITQSTAKAEAKLFGIDTMSDLGTKKLNDVLMA